MFADGWAFELGWLGLVSSDICWPACLCGLAPAVCVFLRDCAGGSVRTIFSLPSLGAGSSCAAGEVASNGAAMLSVVGLVGSATLGLTAATVAGAGSVTGCCITGCWVAGDASACAGGNVLASMSGSLFIAGAAISGAGLGVGMGVICVTAVFLPLYRSCAKDRAKAPPIAKTAVAATVR